MDHAVHLFVSKMCVMSEDCSENSARREAACLPGRAVKHMCTARFGEYSLRFGQESIFYKLWMIPALLEILKRSHTSLASYCWVSLLEQATKPGGNM